MKLVIFLHFKHIWSFYSCVWSDVIFLSVLRYICSYINGNNYTHIITLYVSWNLLLKLKLPWHLHSVNGVSMTPAKKHTFSCGDNFYPSLMKPLKVSNETLFLSPLRDLRFSCVDNFGELFRPQMSLPHLSVLHHPPL